MCDEMRAVPQLDTRRIRWAHVRSLDLLAIFEQLTLCRLMSTSKKRGIHWLAPASATGALVAGLLLTVGHHLFYQSLHETPVCENAFFYRQVSQQQINIAIGTAFAFLAKACMVLAVSIAFVQIFWYATSQRTGDDFPTLERIDAVYSVLDNAIEMFNVKLWYNYPLLMLIAALAWYANFLSQT